MRKYLQWVEDVQRDDPFTRLDVAPQGDQVFTERWVPDRLCRDMGTVLVLSYETWQDLGGPMVLRVDIGPDPF